MCSTVLAGVGRSVARRVLLVGRGWCLNRLAITKFKTSSGSSVAGVSDTSDAMTSARQLTDTSVMYHSPNQFVLRRKLGSCNASRVSPRAASPRLRRVRLVRARLDTAIELVRMEVTRTDGTDSTGRS
jgi:hypothetical protein